MRICYGKYYTVLVGMQNSENVWFCEVMIFVNLVNDHFVVFIKSGKVYVFMTMTEWSQADMFYHFTQTRYVAMSVGGIVLCSSLLYHVKAMDILLVAWFSH